MGNGTFPIPPRHLFDANAAVRAIDPPHEVDEDYCHSPHWNKIKSTGCLHRVIARPNFAATGTNSLAVPPRLNLHFNQFPRNRFDDLDFSKDEGLVVCNAIEDSFELHLVVSFGAVDVVTYLYQNRCKMHLQNTKRLRIRLNNQDGG